MGGIARTAALCGALLACTSVKLVQREGCWVKQTERTLGGSTEELGFCSKPRPEWANDRLSRLVQECMAQADFRWENRALAAWSRNQPIPPPDADEEIAKTCMSQAASALGLQAQNDALQSRLSDVSRDRKDLQSASEKSREFLEQSSDKMISALGEAAKRPPPSAVATATSTGTAKTESDQRAAQQPVAATPDHRRRHRAAGSRDPGSVCACPGKSPLPREAGEDGGQEDPGLRKGPSGGGILGQDCLARPEKR